MASPHDDEISNFQRRKDSADSADDSPCAMGQSSRRVSADLAPIWEGTSPISPLSLPILGHADGAQETSYLATFPAALRLPPPSQGSAAEQRVDTTRKREASRISKRRTRHSPVVRGQTGQDDSQPKTANPHKQSLSQATSYHHVTPGGSELMGFVSWFLSFVCGVVWFAWAWLPDSTLDQLGATYRPDKYWALAGPAFLCTAFLYYLVACVSLGLSATPPLNSMNNLTDSHSFPEVLPHDQAACSPEQIARHSDIPITKVNRIMGFRSSRSRGSICKDRE